MAGAGAGQGEPPRYPARPMNGTCAWVKGAAANSRQSGVTCGPPPAPDAADAPDVARDAVSDAARDALPDAVPPPSAAKAVPPLVAPVAAAAATATALPSSPRLLMFPMVAMSPTHLSWM